jgi:hypothetical protein
MANYDCYNIPLKIFRNREWVQPITISNTDVSKDKLALVVIPSDGGDPLLTNTTPIPGSGVGSVTFISTDTATGALLPGGYRWQYLRKPQFATQTDLVVAGRLTVSDSPPFPTP